MGDFGYPTEWFVEPIDDYLKCGICGQVLRDPRATQCGHVYCNKCLTTWIHAYGICPNRCGEVEVESTRRALHIEKRISGLFIVCSNQHLGCTVQVQLIDKERHEKSCPYYRQQQQSSNESSTSKQRPTLSSTLSQQDLTSRPGKKQYRVHHKRARSFGSTHHTKTIVVTPRRSATNRSPRISHTITDSHGMQATTHTFRLKRTRTKEPLGLVLVSGEKTQDGRPMSFYVKDVNPDTLGSKAGFKAGDRIVQVDFYELSKMNPQEAVARIKEKTLVTLTVLRGLEPLHSTITPGVEEHIYDEIVYNDFQQSQGHSQQDENSAPGLFKNRKKHSKNEDSHRQAPQKRPTSPAANFFHKMRGGQTVHDMHHHPHQGGEKGSKDSGLSSGSSGSHPRHMNTLVEARNIEPAMMERGVDVRHSYRTQREMMKNFLKEQKRNGHLYPNQREDSRRRNCRIEGEYEVEEIYLEKNGTSQLGVTLGYDTKTAKGHLYVCEVLPTGLAAQDGRLRCGDIIRRVNGFEVYDPEEAVLLFLEQDQDITLTVARKIKPVSNRLLGSSSASQPEQEHTYAVLEQTLTSNTSSKLRRIDSCGSLDSHSHKYMSTERLQAQHHQHQVRGGEKEDDGYEPVKNGRQRRSSSPVIHQMRIRRKSPSQSPPRNPSSLATDSLTQPPAHGKNKQQQLQPEPNNDCTFRPISVNEARVRPSTVSVDHQTSPNARRVARPSSTTPDNRHRINYEPKIMSPGYPPKKPSSFRMLANEIHKLPSRCDNVDYRSESLV